MKIDRLPSGELVLEIMELAWPEHGSSEVCLAFATGAMCDDDPLFSIQKKILEDIISAVHERDALKARIKELEKEVEDLGYECMEAYSRCDD